VSEASTPSGSEPGAERAWPSAPPVEPPAPPWSPPAPPVDPPAPPWSPPAADPIGPGATRGPAPYALDQASRYTYGYGYSAMPAPKTSGLAVASLVCGIIGVVQCPPVSIAALVCAILARRQIRESGGTKTGNGLTVAGLVLGGVGVALTVLVAVLWTFLLANSRGPGP
jgi:hypothetical protein